MIGRFGACCLLALVAVGLVESRAAASPSARYEVREYTETDGWPDAVCGVEQTIETELPPSFGAVKITSPLVDDPVTNFEEETVGRITSIQVAHRLRRPVVALTMVGSGLVCGPTPAIGDHAFPITTWTARVLQRLPRGQRFFHAWTLAERPAIRVERRLNGKCTQSYINPRDGAWRCFAGRYVLDPCFEQSPESPRLLCVRSPWATSGILVRGSGWDTWESNRPTPWAIRTAAGRRCSFLGGAGAAFRAGRRMNYGCWDRQGGYLWGLPKRRAGRLMIPYSPDYDEPWRWVRVTERWN
jgi:hypothetical protein